MEQSFVINLLINIVITGFGLYLLYIAITMKRTGKIHNTVLPKEEAIKCKDVKGYVSYITPKMIIFGFVIVFVGIMGIAELYVSVLYRYRFFTLLIFMVMFMVYIYEMRQAKLKYFY